jgi:hypothetical protein
VISDDPHLAFSSMGFLPLASDEGIVDSNAEDVIYSLGANLCGISDVSWQVCFGASWSESTGNTKNDDL